MRCQMCRHRIPLNILTLSSQREWSNAKIPDYLSSQEIPATEDDIKAVIQVNTISWVGNQQG